MRTIIAAAFLLAAAPAIACSPQDVQAKAMEISTGAQQLAAKNPQAATEWSKKASEAQMKAAQTTDMQQICKLYDQLLADLRAVK